MRRVAAAGTASMGDGTDVSRDTVMLTYEELAARLGIDVVTAQPRPEWGR